MMKSPTEIVNKIMYDKDAFSQWMGMEVVHVSEGECKVSMTVRQEMLNGFGIAHGGITYALADSAFAFACNSQGEQAVSVETAISHTSKVTSGDTLTASATMIQRSRKIGRFDVKIHNQDEELVAHFKGTCYYTGKEY